MKEALTMAQVEITVRPKILLGYADPIFHLVATLNDMPNVFNALFAPPVPELCPPRYAQPAEVPLPIQELRNDFQLKRHRLIQKHEEEMLKLRMEESIAEAKKKKELEGEVS